MGDFVGQMMRMAVARFESTPSIPTFDKMEVSAAKIADSSVNKSHMQYYLLRSPSTLIISDT